MNTIDKKEESETTEAIKKDLSLKRSIAVLIGNFIEYFDLLLYTNLMFIISPLFSPKNNQLANFIFEAGSFASGWIIRPIAAIIFGYIADHISRKQMLLASTTMMGISTLIIASTPSYESIGIAAPIIIITCRLLQGFSNVGEFVGSTIYLVEHAPSKYKSLFSSFVYVSSTLGGLCATLCGSLCIKLFNENPGWRIPFFIGSGIMVFGGLLRKMLPEDQIKIKKKVILWQDLLEKKWPAIGGVLINMCHPIIFYLTYIYVPKILNNYVKCSSSQILLQTSLVSFYEICLVIVLGYVGDIMPVKKVAYLRALSVALLAMPCVWLLSSCTRLSLFIAQIILVSISHAELPLLPETIKLFSGQRIYSSFGFVWSIGRSIMYGLVPLISVAECYFGSLGLILSLLIMSILYFFGIFCLFKKDTK